MYNCEGVTAVAQHFLLSPDAFASRFFGFVKHEAY